ncbi:MAG: hypothetical protein DSY37_02305 [Hyperthermus sp.]|nr:MAG: hypothetical protein DSY37_02305 [Hyperthermus sp.]
MSMEGEGYPRSLEPGSSLRLAEASISFSASGLLEACDPYGCVRARVRDTVLVEPVPGVLRPRPLTGCIYVEFEESYIHPGGEADAWMLAPYELAVVYRDTVIARLTPLPAKFTLIGDIVDGTLCRHSRSKLAWSPEDASSLLAPGLGLVRVRFRGEPANVPGVGFYAATLPLYTDGGSKIYYPLVEAVLERNVATIKSTSEPPLKGLRVAQRGKRPLIFLPTLTQPLPSQPL